MTNEELAIHWGIPVAEVENISKFMNETYYLCVGRSCTDKLWYGMMYEIVEHRPRLSVSSKQGFRTSREACEFMNNCMDTLQMPEGRSKIHGVPKDAFKVLKRLEISCDELSKRNTTNIHACVGRGGRD